MIGFTSLAGVLDLQSCQRQPSGGGPWLCLQQHQAVSFVAKHVLVRAAISGGARILVSSRIQLKDAAA